MMYTRNNEVDKWYNRHRDYICNRINKGEEIESIAKDLDLNLKTLYAKCNKWKEQNYIQSIIKLHRTPKKKNKGNNTNVNNVKPLHKEKYNIFLSDLYYDYNNTESQIYTESECTL